MRGRSAKLRLSPCVRPYQRDPDEDGGRDEDVQRHGACDDKRVWIPRRTFRSSGFGASVARPAPHRIHDHVDPEHLNHRQGSASDEGPSTRCRGSDVDGQLKHQETLNLDKANVPENRVDNTANESSSRICPKLPARLRSGFSHCSSRLHS